jgi:cation diffusion facilitator CzcD-associated flavoprotein CzcO
MTPQFETCIIGAGFSGLAMGLNLIRSGNRNFVMVEKEAEVGGTWLVNSYPGCACDIPSHLYSFSFEPNPNWSRMYAPQPEILEYLKRCADKYSLRPHIRFRTTLSAARYDEAHQLWHLTLSSGDTLTSRFLVMGVGPLRLPAYPKLPGVERFQGRSFHSARWDHGFELAGKRVAVVGTGASAIQFVPRLAPKVERLHLFQRTPPWVLPRPDRAVRGWERKLFTAVPVLQTLMRYLLYWRMEGRGLGFTWHPGVMRLAALLGKFLIGRQLKDKLELRAKVTPDYLPGCKRVLMADDYYPALARPNVEVVTSGIKEVREHSVVGEDGVERPVDALIYGTGFRVQDMLSEVKIEGRGGQTIAAAWAGGLRAYFGTTLPGFPNLFLLLGPNTGLGHNSVVFMAEAQVSHILSIMEAARRRNVQSVEVRPEFVEALQEELRPRLAHSVWASGCQSWYLDAKGDNPTIWPGTSLEFWARTRQVREEEYAWYDEGRTRAPVPGSAPVSGYESEPVPGVSAPRKAV